MKRFFIFRHPGKLFFIGFLLFFFSPPLKGEIVDRVVAIVNNEIITLSELFRAAQVQSPEENKFLSSSKYQEVLEGMIEQKLIDQETLGEEVQVSENEVNEVIEKFKEKNGISAAQLNEALSQQGITWEKYRKKIREEIRRSQIVTQKVRSQVNVTEKELKEYYRNHQDDYFEPARVKIEQIFFPLPPEATEEMKNLLSLKANEVLRRIKTGEDFNKVAQEKNFSEGKSSYDLGYFKKGELMMILDEEAFRLKNGEVSNVITTNKGYFIIRLLDRTDEKTKKFNEVKEEIANGLLQQKMEKKFRDWIEELRNKAYIEIKI